MDAQNLVDGHADLEKLRVDANNLSDALKPLLDALDAATSSVASSASGSWIGYQSNLYYGDFEPAPPYNSTWGGRPEGWQDRRYEEVLDQIEGQAGTRIALLIERANEYRAAVDAFRDHLAVLLAPVADLSGFEAEVGQLDEIRTRKWIPTTQQILQQWVPGSIMTRDQAAVSGGVTAPAHKRIQASLVEARRHLLVGTELMQQGLVLARRVAARRANTPIAEIDPGDEAQVVFLVHGRDSGAKNEVARFLERLDVPPIILHEQPNQGQTLVEKLVESGSRARYAIVILSPDDVGGLAGEEHPVLEPRARQNVIFELGYFMGAFGRQRVCALLTSGVARPSDIDGVVYIDMASDWKIELGRELKAGGFAVDMNKAI